VQERPLEVVPELHEQMALVALDCLVAKPKWPRGMLIGVAAAIKLTPAVFVLFFLLRRDYRSAVTAAVSPRSLPQSSTGRFDVISVEAFS